MALPAGKRFVDALVQARVISANDLERIQKITIVIEPGPDVNVRVDYIGDEKLLDALPALEGVTSVAVAQKG